jgi:hypothetical protein
MIGATEQNSDIEIPKIASWFLSNYAYTTLLLLPIFSLASYISFYKFHKTYLEHVVINSYITGHQAFLYTLFAFTGTIIDSNIMEVFSAILAISFTFWVYWHFFSAGNRTINLVRSTLTYLLYLIFSTLLLGFLMINEL